MMMMMSWGNYNGFLLMLLILFLRSSSGSPSASSPERSKDKKTSASGGIFHKSSAAKPQKMADFSKDCLQAHNAKRKLHGSPALSLASDLSEHAQKWAEHLAAEDMLKHSYRNVRGSRVGENLASSWSPPGAGCTGEEVVNLWYSEIEKYDFQSKGSLTSVHFTQVVWKGSRELGVGKAQTSFGRCIVVCNYRPPGNIIGAYRDNVLPPK